MSRILATSVRRYPSQGTVLLSTERASIQNDQLSVCDFVGNVTNKEILLISVSTDTIAGQLNA